MNLQLKTLEDYIKVFITKKYITKDTSLIRITLDDGRKMNLNICVKNKNNFTIKNNFDNLLDLPVTKIKAWTGESFETVTIDEIEDPKTNRIKYDIMPKLSILLNESVTPFILYFECVVLPKIYTDSFLYKLDFFTYPLYLTLRECGNTVISRRNYSNIQAYVFRNSKQLIEKYSLKEQGDDLVEQVFKAIVGLEKGSYEIKNVIDHTYSYYIIKVASKTSKKSMSKI